MNWDIHYLWSTKKYISPLSSNSPNWKSGKSPIWKIYLVLSNSGHLFLLCYPSKNNHKWTHWTLMAKASGCTSSVRTEIAVVSNFGYYLIMTLPEAALKKLSMSEIVSLPLDCQNKCDSKLASIRNELCYLKKDFEKLGFDLSVARQVNSVLRERVTSSVLQR